MKFPEFVKKTFTLDDRSLALYRFFLGILVMADILYRWGDVANFYTDSGILPRSLFLSEMSMPWSFSILLANGSEEFCYLIFSIQLILGLMLTFGYKTRAAIIGVFILTVSIHNRNWMINSGGHDVLRSLLFFSMFLPLNRCFSIDSALVKEKKKSEGFFSSWGLAFFLQIFLIYFVSYILKNSEIWRKDFTAFFFSSRLDIFATPFGIWLRDFPLLGKAITMLSVYLEWLGPLILLFSFILGKRWWMARLMLVVLFISFHIGIFLTMNIGLFTFICESMWVALIPGPFWDKVEAFFKNKNAHKLSIFYDGECGFCQKSVRIIREFLLLKEVNIGPGQENESIYKDMTSQHSWVVVNEHEQRFFKYEAFLEILKHSPHGRMLYPFFCLAPIKFFGGKMYHWVSNHREFMGKFSQHLTYQVPKSEFKAFTWIFEAGGVFFFITLLLWNLTTIKQLNYSAPFFQNITRWFHLYQEWNMFAPYPKMNNIWVQIPAELSDGSQMELLTSDRDIYSFQYHHFNKNMPNDHWRKFYLNMSDKVDYARYYGGFLCRQWNDKKIRAVDKVDLKKLEIIIYSQFNLPNGDKSGISRGLSWKHWCFERDYKLQNVQKK
jgi:predicted DCC family thiol-disulfide oxidoreductase YuxK